MYLKSHNGAFSAYFLFLITLSCVYVIFIIKILSDAQILFSYFARENIIVWCSMNVDVCNSCYVTKLWLYNFSQQRKLLVARHWGRVSYSWLSRGSASFSFLFLFVRFLFLSWNDQVRSFLVYIGTTNVRVKLAKYLLNRNVCSFQLVN